MDQSPPKMKKRKDRLSRAGKRARLLDLADGDIRESVALLNSAAKLARQALGPQGANWLLGRMQSIKAEES